MYVSTIPDSLDSYLRKYLRSLVDTEKYMPRDNRERRSTVPTMVFRYSAQG